MGKSLPEMTKFIQQRIFRDGVKGRRRQTREGSATGGTVVRKCNRDWTKGIQAEGRATSKGGGNEGMEALVFYRRQLAVMEQALDTVASTPGPSVGNQALGALCRKTNGDKVWGTLYTHDPGH